MTRRLVITADDVGADPAASAAVVELVRDGRVTAASVIPVARWAPDAVRALAPYGRSGTDRVLSIGPHATLITDPDGSGWRPLSRAPSLLAPAAERFHSDVGSFAAAALPAEVLDELRAQVAWFAPWGARPDHLDSHLGTLLGFDGPHFLDAAIRVCAEHDLVLRLPRSVPRELGALPARLLEMHRRSVALADEVGVRIPATVGTDWRAPSQLSGYRDLRDAYLALLRALPEGLSEIFLHPAAEPAAGAGLTGAMVKRVWERRLLQDDLFADVLAAEGISVVPWPAPADGASPVTGAHGHRQA